MTNKNRIGSYTFNSNPEGNIVSGNFTPTVTGQVNITAMTHFDMKYIRVGNMVMVSGNANVQASVANTQTLFEVDLPFPSDFTSSDDGTGTGGHLFQPISPGFISCSTANNTLQFIWNPTSTLNAQFNYTAMYEIK
jgi:hypothetical protein